MPHVSFHIGKPIHERTGRQLIWAFVIVPIVLSIILLSIVGWLIVHHRADFSRGDWFGVAWLLIVVPVLVLGLPATAWREWQRRKQFSHKESGG